MESISIIIVNLNGAKHLKKCLGSINDLDYPEEMVEVIVFDNGSKDNSIDIIREVCPGATILENPENIGFAPPHRIAAEAAKGDVLAFLNNDTRVDSRWAREGTSVLDRSEGIVCSASKLMTWNGSRVEFNGGTLQYLGYADQLTENDLKTGDEILFPCGGAMFIFKDVFRDVDCFDDDYFAIFEDVDLGWRLWVMGYRVVMAPDSIVYHRGHSTLDSQKEEKKRFLMHRNALMTIIKNYDEVNLKKILPMAMALAVKRALLFMNIDKKRFYFWENQAPTSGIPPKYEEGCIHLAALDDVFEAFRDLEKKREAVQKNRKRDDADIFKHFKDPFRNVMGYSEYLWAESSLFGKFSLEQLFDCRGEYKKRIDEGLWHAEERLEALKKIARKEMLSLGNAVDGTVVKRHLFGAFSRTLMKEGPSATIKKTTTYMTRSLGNWFK